jgi:hypothetical protein
MEKAARFAPKEAAETTDRFWSARAPAPLSGRSEVIGKLDAPDCAQKQRFRTNEPKLLKLQTLYKKLIDNNLRIKKTCVQENNAMKNEPKLWLSTNLKPQALTRLEFRPTRKRPPLICSRVQAVRVALVQEAA